MRSKFIACYAQLFSATEQVRVDYAKEVVWAADGQAWAFNGWDTFYQLGGAAIRRRPTPAAPRRGARHG